MEATAMAKSIVSPPPLPSYRLLSSVSSHFPSTRYSRSLPNPISLRSSIGSKKRPSFVACSSDGAGEELPIEKRFPAFPTVMDINQICNVLPHRFPFLLVDRVIEYNPGVSAVAIKNVTINDNFFPGHFPERPIMPGVLMVEVLLTSSDAILANLTPALVAEANMLRERFAHQYHSRTLLGMYPRNHGVSLLDG